MIDMMLHEYELDGVFVLEVFQEKIVFLADTKIVPRVHRTVFEPGFEACRGSWGSGVSVNMYRMRGPIILEYPY